MRLVVPSRGRADTIRMNTLSLLPEATVVVDEREKAAYAKVVPKGQLVTHPGPPELLTLTGIRNWIMDNVGPDDDGVLVMLDDDIFMLKSIVGWSPRRYRDPQVARQVLENAAQCCLDCGCGLFGFNENPHPLHFKPFDPLRLATRTGSVYGFVGEHGLRFDDRLWMHEDVDLCLMALMLHRFLWCDERWAFVNMRMTNQGGLAHQRSVERMEETHRLLREKWGDVYIRYRTTTSDHRRTGKGLKNANTLMTTLAVPRKSRLVSG